MSTTSPSVDPIRFRSGPLLDWLEANSRLELAPSIPSLAIRTRKIAVGTPQVASAIRQLASVTP